MHKVDNFAGVLTLPNGLQSLTLQSLTFGVDFNQSLDVLTLPNGAPQAM